MEGIREWVMTLCACAALLSIAEVLLPEGAVRRTSYLVLSLIAVSCLASPLLELSQLSLTSDFSADYDPPAAQDWLLSPTMREFEANVRSLVRERLLSVGVRAEDIEVCAEISDEGEAELKLVRVTLGEQYAERLDEIERFISRELGTDVDIIVEG